MCFEDFSKQTKALEVIVRYGYRPDHPHLLYQYLSKGAGQAAGRSEEAERRVHLHLFNTLLEAICDTNVAYHWRCLCLDHIHRPLIAIGRLARSGKQKAQVRYLRYELYTLSNYFLRPPPAGGDRGVT